MEEQVQMNEKLRALLEKAKREKKIASKDLIDTLEAIDADEKQTELIYEALDEAGVEIDVSDVVELLSKPEEMLPSEEDLELIEEEKIIDTEDLSENMSLNDPVRMYLKEIVARGDRAQAASPAGEGRGGHAHRAGAHLTRDAGRRGG